MLKTTDYYPTKTTALLSLLLGGQFQPVLGGQFKMAKGGHFDLEGGGQFAWVFQKGKERLYFKLNWKVEGIEFKDDAPCSAKKNFDTSSNIQTYQCVDDAGRLLAEIKVDIDKAFIYEKNKPL